MDPRPVTIPTSMTSFRAFLLPLIIPLISRYFNLGESLSIRLSEVLRLLEEVSGRKPKIQNFPAQPGDVNLTYADISKARRMLDYQLRTRFEEGLSEFVRWFERNSMQLDLQVNR